jgi:hypothetical protein
MVRTLIPLLALGQAAPALANGQQTHLWITNEALLGLPPGDLRDLLARPDVQTALWNGTMFPDGGYAVGDDYGEMAHWEPFQAAYLAWIQRHWSPPYDDPEAARHVAFLFGLRSHGMADEVFDCLFMEESRVRDDDGSWGDPTSLDTASDVMLVAWEGGTPVPESWYPEEAVLSVYWEDLGYDVDPAVIAEGQDRLFVALAFGEWAANEGNRLPAMVEQFPWTAEHFLEATQAGAPPEEARIVASYWESEWARLTEGRAWAPVLLHTTPDDGAWRHPQDHTTVPARLHLTFARALHQESVTAARFTVTGEDGHTIPVEPWLFYGESSHNVLLVPGEDWEVDTAYTVRVEPGIETLDGLQVEVPIQWTFSTAEPPPVGEDPIEEGGCDVAGGTAGGLLGASLVLGVIGRRRRQA